MSKTNGNRRTCAICGNTFPQRDVVVGGTIRDSIAALILQEHPDWTHDSYICRADLAKFRGAYVRSILASEKGEVTALEEQVLSSLREHEVLTKNTEAGYEGARTLGERLADHLASFGGSWAFMGYFAALLAVWIGANSLVFLWHPPDPYPFILLNLILSCLASIQAPIIMMSQNRQEAKDRVRSQHDYQVNLKAELEIRQLHEKIDHLLAHQWERMVQIQELQIELLSELGRAPAKPEKERG